MRNPQFRVLFKIITALVFFTLLYHSQFSKVHHENGVKKNRRVIQEIYSSSLNISSSGNNNNKPKLLDMQVCDEFFDHKGYTNSCDFLIANPDCTSGGYFNYIKFFYCDCQNYSFWGYIVLGAWLAILFYLLGNTAADYFCCSLETLSNLLKMSPTIAGVTLLPFGNGACDVFASIAAFMGTGSGDVGANGILGGAVFITCIVVGAVSICVADKGVQIDKKCFIRDICFLLFTMLCLTLMMIIGKLTIWGAIAFVSIYVVYVLYVVVSEIMMKKGRSLRFGGFTPLLPVAGSFFSSGGEEDNESVNAPLLSPDTHAGDLTPKQAHMIWTGNFAMFSDYVKVPAAEDVSRPLWGWSDGEEQATFSFSNLCWLLEQPLSIPRRLTIPIVEEDRWSKMYAVASAFLAPVLLAFLWNTRDNVDPLVGRIAYFAGFGIGFILSILASLYTSIEHPPRKFLLPWVLGGFFMSVIWFYILADELVTLLVSLGTILGISPSMLALTVLAWGNSMNDLMSNTAFAMNERNGVQIAMSGCYAGPMFNTLVGLGLSLVLGTWSMGSSEPYVIPRDAGLFVTMGFLTAGVVWSFVVLPMYDMRPNKVLGVGLIIIYVIFLSLRISMAIGLGSLQA